MPSLASAYTEFTGAWPPPPPPPKGAAGVAGTAGAGAAGAAPAGGIASPRPKMSGTPWPGSPTIALAALIRLPPPRPGVRGRRLVGRVAAAVNPPGQRSDPPCDAGEELNFVFQYIRARS